MQVTLEASMSPLVLCDRLLTLAQDADRAGLRRAAESLLEVVGAVLEPTPKRQYRRNSQSSPTIDGPKSLCGWLATRRNPAR
jgi:hypothetical protein